jgi:glycosyltransferase involved in cell wall biosynthesis
VKVLLVSSHPVQYTSPLYRLYAEDPRLEVTVAYCSLQGAEPGVDPEFGVEVAWDVPLLEGYRWVNPGNRSPRPGLRGFFGLLNPGLWREVRAGGYDVVVCFGWHAASFWIAALAARLSGARLVFTTDAHTLAPRGGQGWKLPLKRLLVPRILGFADAVFVPSSRTRRFVQDLGVPESAVHLIPYVVDNSFFTHGAARARRAALRKAWGVPDDAPVALFAGKLVAWKRPLDLLQAVAASGRWWAVFAGEGDLKTALEREAARLGVADRTRFLGFVNQKALPDVYGAADLLVLPSEHEPFGLVVNEAFACGLPAIVSDACGAAGDLVRDGETGFVVAAGDVDALADRLRSLADERPLLRRLGRQARARIAAWGPGQNLEAFAGACHAVSPRRVAA